MWPFSRSKQYRLPNYLSSLFVFTTKQSSCEWYTSTKTQSITVTCSSFIAMFQGLHTTPPALDHFQSANMKGGKLVLNPLEEGLGTRLGESLPSYTYLMFLYMMRTPLLCVCVHWEWWRPRNKARSSQWTQNETLLLWQWVSMRFQKKPTTMNSAYKHK